MGPMYIEAPYIYVHWVMVQLIEKLCAFIIIYVCKSMSENKLNVQTIFPLLSDHNFWTQSQPWIQTALLGSVCFFLTLSDTVVSSCPLDG